MTVDNCSIGILFIQSNQGLVCSNHKGLCKSLDKIKYDNAETHSKLYNNITMTYKPQKNNTLTIL